MIKVVIDTNVVVSANLVDAGPSAAIFHLATNKKILMCISPAVLAEYEKVLRRPRLKLDPAKIAGALALIRSTSTEVNPTTALKISRDESDNCFLRMCRRGLRRLPDHRQHPGLQQRSRPHKDHHAQGFH